MSLSDVRKKCKELGYGVTQEGEEFILSNVPGFKPFKFSKEYWFCNWMYHHLALDLHKPAKKSGGFK